MPFPPIRRVAPYALALCGFGSGCDPSITNPDPPSGVVAVEEGYEHPSGSISDVSLAGLRETFRERAELLENTGNLGLLYDLTDQALDPESGLASEGEEPVDTTEGARILGVLRIFYTCRGPEGNSEVDAEANGRATLVAKASNRGIFPVVWGEFRDCVDRMDGVPFTIDGDYFVLLRKTDAGLSRLVWFDGTIEVAGLRHRGEISYLRNPDGSIELAIAVADGSVVIGASGRGRQLVRDRDDEWSCQLDALECQSESTGDVVSATPEVP